MCTNVCKDLDGVAIQSTERWWGNENFSSIHDGVEYFLTMKLSSVLVPCIKNDHSHSIETFLELSN